MVDNEIVELIERARRVDKEVIEDLPPAYRYQFARVRDDIDIASE